MTRIMKKSTTKRRFFLILILTVVTGIIGLPKNLPIKFNIGSWEFDQKISSPEIDWKLGAWRFNRDLNIKKGLDLSGGTQLILQAEMDQIPEADRAAALASAQAVISRRIDLYGVSETLIQTAKSGESYRMIVELPGIADAEQAKQLIGKTAKLEFKEPDPEAVIDEEASGSAAYQEIFNMKPTDLTGQDLQKAEVKFDDNSGEPVVGLIFTPEGQKKFAEITKKNVGQKVGIFLDEIPITIPMVQTPILDGQAIISGGFTTESAKQLVISLNAGVLPVDLAVVSQTQIGATLGADSVSKSVKAGMIGILIVAIFMVAVYRKLGLIADVALVIYGLITLSIYKLIPITLSLPGIAGFLLSIGMATDANILIFERTKEELKRGMKLSAAVELGFGRAWDSIKDANATTLLTAFILYNPFDWNFLNTSGMVRGFALTLTIGIIISLFTGIFVSRTLIRLFYVIDKKK